MARTINPPSSNNLSNGPSSEVAAGELEKATTQSQKAEHLQNSSPVSELHAVPFPQDPTVYQTLWFPQKPPLTQPSKPTAKTVVAALTTRSRYKRQETTTTPNTTTTTTSATTEKPPTVLQQYFETNPDGSYEQRWVQSTLDS